MGTCRGAKYLSTSVEAVEVRGEVAMAPVGGEATVLVICPYKVKTALYSLAGSSSSIGLDCPSAIFGCGIRS